MLVFKNGAFPERFFDSLGSFFGVMPREEDFAYN
jgi:hypothetical protein